VQSRRPPDVVHPVSRFILSNLFSNSHGFEVSVSLRSAQSQGPPDLVRPVSRFILSNLFPNSHGFEVSAPLRSCTVWRVFFSGHFEVEGSCQGMLAPMQVDCSWFS